MHEFELIKNYFQKLSKKSPSSLNLNDDVFFDKKNKLAVSVDTYVEDSANTIHLIEDWESLDHQSKYLNWRIETGLLDVLEPLLSGGAGGLKAIVCGPKHDNI